MSNEFDNTNILPNTEPAQQPVTPQKPKLNTWTIALIIAVIAIIVGLAAYAGYSIIQPIVQHEDDNKIIEPIEQTTIHQDYKKVLSLKGIRYTEEEQAFKGIPFKQPEEMGRFFDKDNENNFYIYGMRGLKILTDSGNLKSVFQLTGIRGGVDDLVVDNNDNIFILDGGIYGDPLLRYTTNGVFQEKINIMENIPTGTSFLPMYIVNNKIYMSDGEMSHLIGAINNGILEKVSPLSFRGILGSVSGNLYDGSLEPWKKATMNILDFSSRDIIQTINFDIKGIVGIKFLGEDQNNNIYFEIEITTDDGLIEEIHKFDSSGKLLTILDISENAKPYIFRSNRHRVVDDNGDIWQIYPENDGYGWCINKWSVTY